MSIIDLQAEFMEKAGQRISGNDYKQSNLYADLIIEEFNEFDEVESDETEMIKECCDLLVVASGFLISLLGKEKAIKAYELVHNSNMAKLEGKIEKREDGKVLKNDTYKKIIKEQLMNDLAALINK